MDINNFSINIEEIWCDYGPETASKENVVPGGRLLSGYEDYVKRLYEDRGFTVIRGEDVAHFFWFCCGKEDCERNTGLSRRCPRFVTLNAENKSIFDAGLASQKHKTVTNNAAQMWLEYYDTPYRLPPKGHLGQAILNCINSLEEKEIINLLELHLSDLYFINGVSDFFVCKPATRERQFIEVKSYEDGLRLDQIKFASAISRKIGNIFTLAFVLPSNLAELQRDKQADALYSFIAKDLRKLSLIGVNLVWEGYSRAENKALFAIKDCKVNPNSLVFFLAKNKNITPEYDVGFLNFAGKIIPLEKCLERLEVEWNKLPRRQT